MFALAAMAFWLSYRKQAADRSEFYGRMTAVMEGLAEGQRRHDREIEALKDTQVYHGNRLAVLSDRLEFRDTGTPGVHASN